MPLLDDSKEMELIERLTDNIRISYCDGKFIVQDLESGATEQVHRFQLARKIAWEILISKG